MFIFVSDHHRTQQYHDHRNILKIYIEFQLKPRTTEVPTAHPKFYKHTTTFFFFVFLRLSRESEVKNNFKTKF